MKKKARRRFRRAQSESGRLRVSGQEPGRRRRRFQTRACTVSGIWPRGTSSGIYEGCRDWNSRGCRETRRRKPHDCRHRIEGSGACRQSGFACVDRRCRLRRRQGHDSIRSRVSAWATDQCRRTMDAARAVVELFDTRDSEEARRLANHLDARNEERKTVQQQIIDLAVAELNRSNGLLCGRDCG